MQGGVCEAVSCGVGATGSRSLAIDAQVWAGILLSPDKRSWRQAKNHQLPQSTRCNFLGLVKGVTSRFHRRIAAVALTWVALDRVHFCVVFIGGGCRRLS